MRSLHQYLNGEEVVDDPDVARVWTVALIAKEFGVLPTWVARDLDNDPEQMTRECYQFLKYAEAKTVYNSCNKQMIDSWRKAGSEMLKLVEEIDESLITEKIEEDLV